MWLFENVEFVVIQVRRNLPHWETPPTEKMTRHSDPRGRPRDMSAHKTTWGHIRTGVMEGKSRQRPLLCLLQEGIGERGLRFACYNNFIMLWAAGGGVAVVPGPQRENNWV